MSNFKAMSIVGTGLVVGVAGFSLPFPLLIVFSIGLGMMIGGIFLEIEKNKSCPPANLNKKNN